MNRVLWEESPLYLSVKSMFDSLHRWRGFRQRRNDLAYRMLGVLRDLLLTLEIRDRRIEELESQITNLVNKGSRRCVREATETSR